MLKWNRNKDFTILKSYGFSLDPTRRYYYKKINGDTELAIYCLADEPFKMYDVVIDCAMGRVIYELDILYLLIKKGLIIKVC